MFLIYRNPGLSQEPVSLNVKEYVNVLFIVEVHLAIKLVHRHLTFNNLKEAIQTLKRKGALFKRLVDLVPEH